MIKVKCEIIVEIDEEEMENLGYDDIDDYLNECKFSCIDDNENDICTEVREYEEI